MNCDVETRFLKKIEAVRSVDGCWEWQGAKSPHGYGLYSFRWKSGGRQTFLAHIFSYQIHFGGTNKLMVCHKCDNPPCVNPDHLFLGTASDNIQDSIRKGRWNHNNSPATPWYLRPLDSSKQEKADAFVARIREIRERAAEGRLTYRELGSMYGLKSNAIHAIATGRSYPNLGGPITRRYGKSTQKAA